MPLSAPVVPRVQALDEAQQVAEAQQTRRESTAAVAARAASRTKFAHLGLSRAAEVAREAFPEAIAHQVGGPPRLPAGQRIIGYASTKAAQIALPGGKHAVVESMQPLAIETSHGHRAPVDLGLTRAGGVFESVRPLVGVLIPQRLSAGVQMPEVGVSLTPVDAQGSSLGGSEGAVDGASVLYANTETDTDTAVKPTTSGVETNTILRSVDSPGQLYFRVGLPAGASLVQAHDAGGSGRVLVMSHGREIALIRPPSASDAEGTSVPVSMSVRGDRLAVNVSVSSGEYRWPIAVDPEIVVLDNELGPAECYRGREGETEHRSSNWCVYAGKAGETGELISKESGPSLFKHQWASNSLVQYNAEYISNAGEYTAAVYHTQGQSNIYKVQMETVGHVKKGRAKLELAKEVSENNNELGVEEHKEVFEEATKESTDSWGWHENHLCAEPASCIYTAGAQGNVAAFKLEANEPGATLEAQQGNAIVYIYQEKGPEPSFNEAEVEIEVEKGVKRLNALHGTHAIGGNEPWLGPYSNTAFEVKAHDPGIGVAWARVVLGSYNLLEPIYEDGKCNGVQCNEEYHTAITYASNMPEGEQTIDWYAADLAGRIPNCPSCLGMSNEAIQLVKVDAKPPSNLEVTGWPAGREITAAQHALTVSATDEAPQSNYSSGVESISVSVDGGPESTIPGASCSPGTCTASGSYTLQAENLTEGVHRLVVTATDNASNVAAKEFTFDVRHGSPVPVGPGTVDPTTGQFKLSASDVSLAGAGAVSRVYESRNLTVGAGGPLGPQWAISLGGGEGLTVLPNGSVVLASSAGATTTFTPNEKEKGQFESPLGDGNVKIEAKEKVPGKGITEYLLQNTTAGTTTTFEQPVGTTSTAPAYSNQFGAEGAQLHTPEDIAVDSSGNEWVTDIKDDRIEKFSPAGEVLGAYGGYGSGSGQFIDPWGLAINQGTGDVYVTDQGSFRVDELSSTGAFIETFGWGVQDGKPQFETCTSECRAGIAGSGAGQFSWLAGIAVDSSGNVWVADNGNNRVDEFFENGVYERSVGSEGTGDDQFKGPLNITFSGGNMYVTDSGNNRVQELGSTGGFVAAIGWGVENGEGKAETCTTSCKAGIPGAGKGQFDSPRGVATDPTTGNLWVAELGNGRAQEFKANGTYITKLGAEGTGAGQLSEASGVAVSASGIYVTDYSGNRVEEWTRPSWLPMTSTGPLTSAAISYVYKAVESEGVTTIEATEAVAPAPAGVSCTKPEEKTVGEALKAGCRALLFTYAEKTKSEIGEAPSAWGEYAGHLKSVSFQAENPSTKKLEEKPIVVAEYAYDSKGRLRAEWDPRIAAATDCNSETKGCAVVKTTYGYDSEGHVTAVSSAGREPWLMHYGALAGDPSTGRLLSVTRPPASSTTVLKEQAAMAAPVYTLVPTLSNTKPEIGVTLNVSSEGKWNNSPLTYSYQWEDCTGSQCTAIPGATNKTYTPQVSDAGYALVGQVTATNADGSAVASSGATSTIAVSAPKYSLTFGSSGTGAGQAKEPTSAAVDGSGNVWVADSVNNRIDKFTSGGTFVETLGFGVGSKGENKLEVCTSSCKAGIAGSGNGQFHGPWGIAVNQAAGNVYVSDQGNFRVEEFTTAGAFVRTFGSAGTAPGQFGFVAGIEIDPNGDVWVADNSNNRVEEFTSTGVILRAVGSTGSGNGQFSGPGGFAFVGGNMYVADFGNKRVQKFSLSGAYLGQFASVGEPFEINENAVTGEIYETDLNGKVDEFNQAGTLVGSFGTKGSGSGQFERPTGLAVNAAGDIYVVDHTLNRLEEWTPTYSTNNPLPEPPALGTSSVTTLAYHVPVSGSGAPYSLSESEVEKWGEGRNPAALKDYPREAMAIFPPDKPMGWPAKEYARATINYMDEKGRTVNVASPSGGISTTEYNKTNDTVRTLSADNRAAALKETGKTAEVAELLDAKSKYNGETKAEQETEEKEILEGKTPPAPYSRLVETLGPEHAVKLAVGKEGKHNEEAKARERVKYFYDEGSPEGKTYNLVTKTKDAAQTASKEEFDSRETTTSYSGAGSCKGREVSGWTLRKPTSVTKEPGGLNLTTTTVYEPCTGNVVETRSPKGSGSGSPAAPVYMSQFGSKGTGGGQFETIRNIALDSAGHIWVADFGNNRIEELSSNGAFLKAVGWGVVDGKSASEVCESNCKAGIAGSGEGQFSGPDGIAVNPTTGNIYVSEATNYRVQVLSPEGHFLKAFGTKGTGKEQFEFPAGIAFESSGDVWVTDLVNDCVEVFTKEGVYVKTIGQKGTGKGEFTEPNSVAFSGSDAYITDYRNDRVEEFSTAGAYIAEFGEKGSGNGQFLGPWGIVVSPETGDLYVSDAHNSRVQEFTPAGTYLTSFGSAGSGAGQFEYATGITVGSNGELWVADQGAGAGHERVEEWEPVPSAPVYASQFGAKGAGAGQFNYPDYNAVDAHGNVWVSDFENNRIEEFSSSGTFTEAIGFGVGSKGEEKLEICASGCKAGKAGTGNGQFSGPVGIAIAGGDIYVADNKNSRVEELTEAGGYVTKFGTKGKGAGQFEGPVSVAIASSGNVWVGDLGNNRMEEFSSSGTFIEAIGFGVKAGEGKVFEICTSSCKAGIAGSGEGQFSNLEGVAVDAGNLYVADYSNNRVEEFNEKGEYVTKFGAKGTGNGQFDGPEGVATNTISGNLYVADWENNRVEEFTPSGAYLTQFGLKGSGNGQLKGPEGIAVNSSGNVYVVDTNNDRVEQWTPAPRPGNEGAHDTRTAYYSSEEESEVAACRKHPEWANLPCQSEPVAQPGVSGSPELPVITETYNIWDEVETKTEKFGTGSGAVTRTTSQAYDAAGRALTSEETSSPVTDTALPKVTNEYNGETGALEKQKATIKGTEKTITSVANTLGELESYTDASGSTSKYVYGGPANDGQIEEMSYEIGKEKFYQVYAYSPTTMRLEKLLDSAAKTFTATYDVEGKMLTEGYPNGMTATYTYNQLGAATAIKYEKNVDCATKCPETWFSDANVSSIHGETLSQASTLAKESYFYDNGGRLTEAQETPTGKGCKSRLYAYNEESDRTSQTTRESSTETCASEGGLLQAHSYDSANHLIDAGVKYEVFGNTTSLPEADAEGHPLTSTYYVDNQVAGQTQNEKTNNYLYDPAGRAMETEAVVKGKKEPIVTSHYSGSGEALTWTSEEEAKKWSRNIPGIDGALDAIETSGGVTTLQLHDLHGNIVGEVGISETETKLTETYNSTEFGVPNEGKAPPKYAWLGAGGVSTELSSGVSTQGGASYVPQIARDLQTAPVVPPGAFPDGQGTGSQYESEIPGWYISLSSQESANTLAEYAAKQLLSDDPDTWIVMGREELLGLVKELEHDSQLVEENALVAEAVGSWVGNLVGGGAAAYSAIATMVEVELRQWAKVIEDEENWTGMPRNYLIHYDYAIVPNINPIVAIKELKANFKLINPVTMAGYYCHNEGTWEANGVYTTYFQCSIDGKWQTWGAPGIRNYW
jgi:DNA-binding beta-propeller fold protein YncE